MWGGSTNQFRILPRQGDLGSHPLISNLHPLETDRGTPQNQPERRGHPPQLLNEYPPRGPPRGVFHADTGHFGALRHAYTDAAMRQRDALLAWFDRHRRNLPWRRTTDPYRIWLSEVML